MNGIKTITVNGKKEKLLFNMRFWRGLSKEGIQMEDLAEALDPVQGVMGMLDSVAKIILVGGQTYASKFKTEFKYDVDDVFEWFEEDITEDVMTEILEAMTEAKILGKNIKEDLGNVQPQEKK